MRLFMAINFSENEKNVIENIIKQVEKDSLQGRFVKNEHIHLTLEFLGETQQREVKMIENIMDQIALEPFTMNLSELGYFKRRDGNIYWLGIENNKNLFEIQRKLHKDLIKEGFKLENRPYKPHITIGRKVKMKRGFNPKNLFKEIRQISINVDKINLMKSEFVAGELIYSIIYSKNL